MDSTRVIAELSEKLDAVTRDECDSIARVYRRAIRVVKEHSSRRILQ